MEEQKARVFCKQKLAGILTKTKNGYEFVYDHAYMSEPDSAPISLSMPMREGKYESKELFPFFDGLLPEGWLLALTSAIAKIDEDDKFALLIHTGEDPVGAISIRQFSEERHDQ